MKEIVSIHMQHKITVKRSHAMRMTTQTTERYKLQIRMSRILTFHRSLMF